MRGRRQTQARTYSSESDGVSKPTASRARPNGVRSPSQTFQLGLWCMAPWALLQTFQFSSGKVNYVELHAAHAFLQMCCAETVKGTKKRVAEG